MIPLFKVPMPDDMEGLIANMRSMLTSGYIAEGEWVRIFEEELKSFLGVKNLVTTNSCTHAIHLALKLAGVGKGEHVITTPMTCVATNVSITNLGGIPVWTDVDPDHGMMTPETVATALKKFPKAKAVIYVMWGGDFGPVEKVYAECKKAGVPLIVDAAQAFGHAKIPGDFVCYSFQAIKHISTGDGGALVVKNSKMLKQATKMKWFGIDRDGFRTPSGEINWKSDIPEIGFKFHMNNIAGVIGTSQMKDPNLNRRLEQYRENDATLTRILKGMNIPVKRSWTGKSASWVCTLNVENPLSLMAFLKSKDIHSSQMHVNNDIYTGFKGAKKAMSLKGVERFMGTHLCIPCGPWIIGKELTSIPYWIERFYNEI
jgi:dTDP-4-amino-4,6-dideoxygalactose transaminase